MGGLASHDGERGSGSRVTVAGAGFDAVAESWLSGTTTGGIWLALAAALVVGLRHATDPDHLTALATLVASERRPDTHRAMRLGFAWGVGHAFTLLALGLPFVLVGRHLPPVVHRAAEVAIGAMIILLSVRLLLRWRRGHFHHHSPEHGELRHAHSAVGRSPMESFGIGLVHGIGGSAGTGVLLVAAIPDPPIAAAALLVFASGTALSMALATTALGHALEQNPVARRVEVLAPPVGTASFLFGLWYALGAAGAVPYPF